MSQENGLHGKPMLEDLTPSVRTTFRFPYADINQDTARRTSSLCNFSSKDFFGIFKGIFEMTQKFSDVYAIDQCVVDLDS